MLNRVKISAIIILCLYYSCLAFSQKSKTDSLISILENEKGEKKMEILRQISKEYMKSSVEDAIKYASTLLELAEKEQNLKYIDLACSFLGEAYYYLDDIEKSIEYFKKFLETNIKQNDIDGIATAYNNLGIVYRSVENYQAAINYYLESLRIKEKLKDSTGISNTLNNIGVLYFHMDDFQNALQYYNRSYKIETGLGNKSGIATSLVNIGEVYSKLNQFDEALSYFQRSIEISESIEDKYTLETNYECMYEMYKRKIEFQKALYYYELYNDLRNVRLNQETRKEIAELEIQYESKKKQQEIELLNKQNELNRFIIIILTIAFTVFIILLFVVYRQAKAKKKALNLLTKQTNKIIEQSKILRNLNHTKDKFFSIISHDLKGAIGGFLSQTDFLAQDFENLTPIESHNLIIRMNQSSEQLYSLLENLLLWSRAQTGDIPYKPENFKLRTLVDSILDLFKEQLKQKELKAIVKVENELEVFADVNMISTVFRNLILNAIKFSYPENLITINSKKNEKKIEIQISDYGVGIKEKDLERLFKIEESFSTPGTKREKGSGLGLILCKEFVEKNGGTIKAESEPGKGSTFIFTLLLS